MTMNEHAEVKIVTSFKVEFILLSNMKINQILLEENV